MTIAIIGGTGFRQLADLQVERRENPKTPFGNPSGEILFGKIAGNKWIFLPRHGANHAIAPHLINYRANLWALKEAGATQIIALAAVGGIAAALKPGDIALPDQIIDYTWGRAHTFHEANNDTPFNVQQHIEFSSPYSEPLRKKIITAAQKANIEVIQEACYAATQGPRLETAAEITRLERDGATIVGMTGMPEAALARELDIQYAAIAIVVNPAAGRSESAVSHEMIVKNAEVGGRKAVEIIKCW